MVFNHLQVNGMILQVNGKLKISQATKKKGFPNLKCHQHHIFNGIFAGFTPVKTNMTWENHDFSIGTTSSNGGFSIVMFVFGGE